MKCISKEELMAIKSEYPEGCRIRLDSDMNDLFNPISSGTEGTVNYVDDMGHIHVKWDTGSSLALIIGEDSFSIIS